MAFLYFLLGAIFSLLLTLFVFYTATYNKELISKKIVEFELKNKPKSQKGGFIDPYTKEDKVLRKINQK